jgi:YfiH family protein
VNLPSPFVQAGEHIAIELPGARAVFTTRRGGFSGGPFESLNLGLLTDDDGDVVHRNRAALADQLGVRFTYIRQVHGPTVLTLTRDQELSPPVREADGQATTLPGVAPMVMTADCLPVAVAGPGAVAIVHAGWRGLADGVIAAGVAALRAVGDNGGDLVAAIGPGAGPCCYEVGPEVHAAFAAHGPGVRAGDGGRNLDLKAIARAELHAAGVGRVHDTGLCTICCELFFSHRRDRGVTGRQAGLVWLT